MTDLYEVPTQMNYSSLFPNSPQPLKADLSTLIGKQYSALTDLGVGSTSQFPTSLEFGTPNQSAFSKFLSNNGDLLKTGGGLLVGGFNAWNGYNQNKLIKQNLQMQESQFREQMNISKQNINRNLEDRQRARVAGNPQAYESVSDYMKKYGVK